MALVVAILAFAGQAYLGLLMVRLVLELVVAFARSWRPRGGVAVAVELVYTITDPPLKLARRYIPPVRMGAVSLDLAFAVVVLVTSILVSTLVRYAVRLGGLG
ncbi:MAG: YggT family protein [Bifidobacteriaceae bacterium]|jgi:YggT family protein|nr:YggT family protein [Bifidobacteriaceae bacterium]